MDQSKERTDEIEHSGFQQSIVDEQANTSQVLFFCREIQNLTFKKFAVGPSKEAHLLFGKELCVFCLFALLSHEVLPLDVIKLIVSFLYFKVFSFRNSFHSVGSVILN